MINIKNSIQCCGCTACESICSSHAIMMVSDEKGFFYPRVNLSLCVNCGLCNKVCPLIQDSNNASLSHETNAFYAARLKDKTSLINSSSGGAFFSLAKYAIGRGGVVVGAAYDNEMVVYHDFADTIDACRTFQGSKYSQSKLTGVFPKILKLLKEGKCVLFSGTPCQNMGLKKYLGKEYSNLITVDIICHSIPSPKLLKDYNKLLESIYKGKLIGINMRDKTFGWSKAYSCKYYFNSGQQLHNPKELKCWQELVESGYPTRECCFNCKFTNLHRNTDFTIGDFWDFGNRRQDIYSKEGTSSVLLNTNKAKEIFKEIKDDILYWEVSKEEILQPRLQVCTNKPSDYDDFWKTYQKNGFIFCYKKYFVQSKYSIMAQYIRAVKRKIKILIMHT